LVKFGLSTGIPPTHLSTPKLTTMKFGLKKLETQLHHMVQNRFDILNRLGMAHKCDDNRAESLLAIAQSANTC